MGNSEQKLLDFITDRLTDIKVILRDQTEGYKSEIELRRDGAVRLIEKRLENAKREIDSHHNQAKQLLREEVADVLRDLILGGTVTEGREYREQMEQVSAMKQAADCGEGASVPGVVVEKIARVCHEVNNTYSQHIGEAGQPAWEDLPEELKDSTREGVMAAILNPNRTGYESHEAWCRKRAEQGWVYGTIKSAKSKTHPCLINYDELPREQKMKDFLFLAVVRGFNIRGDTE